MSVLKYFLKLRVCVFKERMPVLNKYLGLCKHLLLEEDCELHCTYIISRIMSIWLTVLVMEIIL